VRIGVLVAGSTHGASTLTFEGASASMRPSALKALGIIDLPQSDILSFSLALGPGVTWLSVVPNRSTASVETTRRRSLFEPIFSLGAGLRLALSRQTFMSALVGTDISLAPKRLVAADDTDNQLVLATPRVRPLVMLSACASLDGPSRISVPSSESP